ncbi:MAG: NTP transferase domain-containing protein, partial [Luteimonas sp.]|nr:NTP transferase domain-containing protein [Luteimonas sp.]
MRLLGAILCGGAPRGGFANKPLVPFAGVPLAARVLARLAPQVDEAVLVAANPQRLAGLGARVLDDGPIAGQGPLS